MFFNRLYVLSFANLNFHVSRLHKQVSLLMFILSGGFVAIKLTGSVISMAAQ